MRFLRCGFFWSRNVAGMALAMTLGMAGIAPAAEAEPTPVAAVAPSPTLPEAPASPTVEITDPASDPRPTPTPIAFMAPLSLRKAIELIDRVDGLLPTGELALAGLPPDAPVQSLNRMIQSVYQYLEFRDDLHTSLADYQWVVMGRESVQHEPGATFTARFQFNPPVRRISALSFEIDGADAFLHTVVVLDEDGKERERFDRDPPVLLLHSLPRREVFHLWRRTTVSMIEMEISRANTGDALPVATVSGGITENPEYIKTAMYWLRHARTNMDENNVVEVHYALGEARRSIERYVTTLGR